MNFLSLSLLFLLSFFSSSNSTSLHPSFPPFHTHQHQSQSQKLCLDDQRSALLQLQHGLYYSQFQYDSNYDPNITFSSKAEIWDVNDTDCCSWNGVSCDAKGHVIGLDLNNKSLSGSIHSIFNLQHLQSLNLGWNNFNTTLFQYEFDKLHNLTHLNLSESFFQGQIPMGISYLTRLVSLDLSNGFRLKLEKPDLKVLIQNMTSLKELYLDWVNISSDSSKWCETISMALPNLRVLSMSDCGLIGPLCPSLSKLHFLSHLSLDYNPISYLPPNFMEISFRLVALSLSSCNLSGHFPKEVFSFPKFQFIDISNNEALGGQLPEFPLNSSLQSLKVKETNFSGKLPESIDNLKLLTELDLRYNHFDGPIPESIVQLQKLEYLYIGYNGFGSVKLEMFFPLKNLRGLDLSNISLSIGRHNKSLTFPHLEELRLVSCNLSEFPMSIGNHKLLIELDLSYNYFDGPIPESIVQLQGLDLSNISLSIGRHNKSLTFPQLRMLYLSSCNLTEFPEFIKTQDMLVSLDLSNNRIQGFVPNWLWNPNLGYLNLSFNPNIDFPKQFPFVDANSSFPMLNRLELVSCNLSKFPKFLKSPERLEYLDLSNNKISGTIPNWMWKSSLGKLDLSNNHLSSLDQSSSDHSQASSHVSLPSPICNMTQLWWFNASYNNLSGSIPNCFGKFSTLEMLDLQRNNLTGILPNFAEATQLWMLNVGENRLEGKLPRSLANCTQLYVLDVRNNKMHDTFPFWLEKLPSLNVLVLKGNRFYGKIKFRHKNAFPALDVLDMASNEFYGAVSIDFHQTTQLRSFKISGNKLVGKLPRSLANFTKLEVLDVGHNMIQDTFPFWLEKLPNLKVLILRGNRFFGTFKTTNVFPMLSILDIGSNNFSGELSTEFLQCLRAMKLTTDGSERKRDYIGQRYYYQDSMTIVNKGIELFYEKILTLFTCLDLSDNSFHGRIPEEIHNLKSLEVLNLSQNSFSGRIPSTLENLKELESLDLSRNKLSGKIPPQLTSLTFLEALDLSYNQLEGSIPQSNQFLTFSNDSYRENPKLCGPPLTRKCYEVGEAEPPPKEDVDSWLDALCVWKIALIGYGSGIVVGLCVGYTLLNELGNKCCDRLITRNGKGKRRRCR